MTDSRPEITARADGAFVVLSITALTRVASGWFDSLSLPLSLEECFALQCQLATAMQQATVARDRAMKNAAEDLEAAGPMAVATTSHGLRAILENEPIIMEAFRNAAKPKTWRDRAIEEPML